jgi:hypothetical protein
VQRKKSAKSFVIVGASTACRLVAFSATFGCYCLLGIVRLNVSFIIMENYTNSEMTDFGTLLRKCRWCCLKGTSEKFPARRVPHSQTFLAVVQRLRENGTFRPRSLDRSQEGTLRALELEPQILETVEEKPSTSTLQLVREFQVSKFVACRRAGVVPLSCSAGASIATKRLHSPARVL